MRFNLVLKSQPGGRWIPNKTFAAAEPGVWQQVSPPAGTPCELGRRSEVGSREWIGRRTRWRHSMGRGYLYGVLTKRDELLFLVVLALPYASSTGLACTIWSSSEPCGVEKGEGAETDGGERGWTGGCAYSTGTGWEVGVVWWIENRTLRQFICWNKGTAVDVMQLKSSHLSISTCM